MKKRNGLARYCISRWNGELIETIETPAYITPKRVVAVYKFSRETGEIQDRYRPRTPRRLIAYKLDGQDWQNVAGVA